MKRNTIISQHTLSSYAGCSAETPTNGHVKLTDIHKVYIMRFRIMMIRNITIHMLEVWIYLVLKLHAPNGQLYIKLTLVIHTQRPVSSGPWLKILLLESFVLHYII